jgi:hypothetical protein
MSIYYCLFFIVFAGTCIQAGQYGVPQKEPDQVNENRSLDREHPTTSDDEQANRDEQERLFATIKKTEETDELLDLVKDEEFQTPDIKEPWAITVLMKEWGIAFLSWIFPPKKSVRRDDAG